MITLDQYKTSYATAISSHKIPEQNKTTIFPVNSTELSKGERIWHSPTPQKLFKALDVKAL